MIDAAAIARELYDLDATRDAAARRARPQLRARRERRALRAQGARGRGADLALEDAVLEHLRDEPAVPRLAGADDARRRPRRAAADVARGPAVGGRARRSREPRARRSRAWIARWRTSSIPRCTARTRGICATRHDVPALDHLPHQVIHNDANEHNVLVDDGRAVDRADRLRRRGLDRARVRAGGRGRVRDAGPARPGARGRAASCAATTRSTPLRRRRAGGAVRADASCGCG